MRQYILFVVLALQACASNHQPLQAQYDNQNDLAVDNAIDVSIKGMDDCGKKRQIGFFKTHAEATQCAIDVLEEHFYPVAPNKLAVRKLEQQMALIASREDHKNISSDEANKEFMLRLTEMQEAEEFAANQISGQKQLEARQQQQQDTESNSALLGLIQNSMGSYQQRQQNTFNSGRPTLTCNSFGTTTRCY